MRSRRMLAAVLDGVALPGVVMEERSFKHHAPSGTDLARLREDMLSISASFKKMMSQYGNRKAPTSADAKDPASA